MATTTAKRFEIAGFAFDVDVRATYRRELRGEFRGQVNKQHTSFVTGREVVKDVEHWLTVSGFTELAQQDGAVVVRGPGLNGDTLTITYEPGEAPGGDSLSRERMWHLLDGRVQKNRRHLYTGDIVRLRRSYAGDEMTTKDHDAWVPGMPEIAERWIVEDQTHHGHVTLTQQRSEPGSVTWRPTGVTVKVWRSETQFLVALTSDEERWNKLGLDGVSPRPANYRQVAPW